MEKNCRYGFKIIETPNQQSDQPRRIKTISKVMPVPEGVRDHITHLADGTFETLRTFYRREYAELAHDAEAFALECEESYGTGKEAVFYLRVLLGQLKKFGLSHDAVGRLLGCVSAIRHVGEDRYDQILSLPRLIARVKYLFILCLEVEMCAHRFLSWSPHGRNPPPDCVGWYRNPFTAGDAWEIHRYEDDGEINMIPKQALKKLNADSHPQPDEPRGQD